jgi:hypothetical protein
LHALLELLLFGGCEAGVASDGGLAVSTAGAYFMFVVCERLWMLEERITPEINKDRARKAGWLQSVACWLDGCRKSNGPKVRRKISQASGTTILLQSAV